MLSNIKRNSNGFSFVNTLGNLINNKSFKSGFDEFFENKKTEKSFIWHALSEIGDDIGETIYENILNYIDNISNINTCKLKALTSMSKILGVVNFGLLNNLDSFPIEILNALDILSINKSYLLNSNITTPEIRQMILKYASQANLSAGTTLSSSIRNLYLNDYNIINSIDTENYRQLITHIFYDILESYVFMTYGNLNTPLQNDYIYKNISNELTSTNFQNWNSILDQEILKLRNKYSISKKFDQFKIANNIYKGKDTLDNYSYGEKQLILTELRYRDKTKLTRHDNFDSYDDTIKMYTRYAFYREAKVKEYFKFIENIDYIGNNQYINASTKELNTYSLDPNYSVLSSYNKQSLLDSINKKEFNSMIFHAAQVLCDLAFAIVDLREQLKTQSQRNYMTGTELLLAYTINEYLKKNLPLQYPKLKSTLSNLSEFNKFSKNNQNAFGTEIIEYIDTTEYFNLKTDTSKNSINKNLVNNLYWKDTDTFSSVTGDLIKRQTVDDFYNNTLNLKNTLISGMLDDFLNAVYSLGANGTYMSADNVSGIVYPYELELSSSLSAKTAEEISLLSSNQEQIFLRYHGNDIAYFPYYNIKNATHPSYQVHPYMPRFIEYTDIYFVINNAFNNNANENLINIAMTPKLSTILGEYGNILNIWDNNTLDYSGYRSRYEDSVHSIIGELGYANPITNYDGTFYPPALDDYVLAYNNNTLSNLVSCVANEILFDNDQPSFFKKYYKHLNLPSDAYKFIAKQLSTYTDDILEIAKPQLCNEEQYDIYKYGLDSYYNSYILYKKYKLSSSYEFKKNSKGFIWTRFNNHPIGFPAFTGEFPQVLLLNDIMISNDILIDSKIINHELSNIINTSIKYSKLNPYELSANISSFTNDIFFARLNDINLSSDLYADLSSASLFYDMDISSNKKFMSFAIEDITLSSKRDYHSASIINAMPYENTLLNSRIIYKLLRYDNDTDKIPYNDKYDFMGFFQADKSIYSTYLKINDDLSSVNIKVHEFPYKGTRNLKYHKTFSFKQDFDIKNEILSSNLVNIGYANNTFTICLATKVPENVLVNTYIRHNSTVSSLIGEETNYSNVQHDSNLANEYNSADRFESFLEIIEFDEAIFTDLTGKISKSKVYNLNSDASYIPLYVGEKGQILLWSVDRNEYAMANVKSDSIELLGVSYNSIETEIEKKKKYLKEAEDNNFKEITTNEILSAAIRTFEDSNEKSDRYTNYVYELTNRALRPEHDSETYNDISSTYITRKRRFTLNSCISAEQNLSNYMVLLYNSNAGAKYPILAGELSYDLFNDERFTYMSVDSKIDEFIKIHGYRPREFVNVVGTSPFDHDLSSIIDSTNTNHILNVDKISGKLSSYVDNDNKTRFYIEFQLHQNKRNNFVINTDHLVLFVYLKNALGQFSNYHYMEPFDTWPFNSLYTISNDVVESAIVSAQAIKWKPANNIDGLSAYYRNPLGTSNSYLNNINLHGLSAFEQVKELSSNQITFKTSEEDIIGDFYNYPPFLIDEMLDDKFNSTNKLSNKHIITSFELSNTYIFQLANPKEIAEYLANININVYSINQEFGRAYEDFISSQYFIDETGPESLKYMHVFNCDNVSSTLCVNTDNIDDITFSEVQDLSSLSECENALNLSNLFIAHDEAINTNIINRTYQYEVTSEEINKFLKIFVNYSRNPNTGDITLYFNYSNYFNTPFVQKENTGMFESVIMSNTYLSLKPGESGSLDIVIQFKYFDDIGIFSGCTSLPVLSYKIWNVSDDKPKFVIIKKWELQNVNAKNKITDTTLAYVSVKDRIVPASKISDMLNSITYKTMEDIYDETQIIASSENSFKKIKCRFLYETGEDYEFSILPSPDATYFNDNNGVVDIEFTKTSIRLPFKLKADTHVGKRDYIDFPIKMIDGYMIDIHNNKVSNIIFANGVIRFNFGSFISNGTFLAKEHESFGGFIFEEKESKLIHMYEKGQSTNRELATVDTVSAEYDNRILLTQKSKQPLMVELL